MVQPINYWYTKNLSLFTAVLLSVLFITFQAQVIFKYPNYISQSNVLSWDAYGYYMYLPATFIHHDPGIQNRTWLDSTDQHYQQGRPQYQFYSGKNNRLVNVYPCGQAIAMLPFFCIAHGYAALTNQPMDGFSPPYQYLAIVSGLFYSILGIWLLRRILLQYFTDHLSAFVLLLTSLATNQFYYACFDPTSTHNYLFAGNILLIGLTMRWHENPRKITALGIGLLMGWLTVARPSELSLLFIPLLWGIESWQTLRAKFLLVLKSLSHAFTFLLGLLLIGFVQLFYWKYSSGNWFSYNHTEGFDFLHPFTLKFLFHFKKGWFIYTPIMAIATLGFVVLWKKQRSLFVPIITFYMVNLWVVSSWECWWYANSYSQRPMIQSYGIMSLPLGFFIQTLANNRFLKILQSALLLFILLLNLFQIWQYREGIFLGDRMTAAYYRAIFGQLEIPSGAEQLLEIDRGDALPFHQVRNRYRLCFQDAEDVEPPQSNLNPTFRTDSIAMPKGKYCFRMDSVSIYACNWKIPYKQLTEKDHVRILFSADVYEPAYTSTRPKQQLNFCSVISGRQQYGMATHSFDTSSLSTGRWLRLETEFVTPVILHDHDRVQLYLWNSGNGFLYIDNIRIQIFEPISSL